MTRHIGHKGAWIVWALLIIISLFSGWYHASSASRMAIYGIIIFLAAGIKARLVIIYFMELRNTATAWRIAFELWVVLTTALLIGVYLLSNQAS